MSHMSHSELLSYCISKIFKVSGGEEQFASIRPAGLRSRYKNLYLFGKRSWAWHSSEHSERKLKLRGWTWKCASPTLHFDQKALVFWPSIEILFRWIEGILLWFLPWKSVRYSESSPWPEGGVCSFEDYAIKSVSVVACRKHASIAKNIKQSSSILSTLPLFLNTYKNSLSQIWQ